MNKEKIEAKLRIYTRLMRADKPIGTMLLLWPTLWALWAAAGGMPDIAVLAAFVLGTFLMRSAGCVANDFADRDFDGRVARTKNRPFARGEVSGREALLLILVLCAAAALCLLPLNRLTWLMSLPALFLAFTYPFTKRFFPIPQLYLGLAFSFGIPMAFAAVRGSVPPPAWILFAANVFWTLAYDTAYAMADKPDDLKIGIKTSAITFGRRDAEAVLACHLASTALMAWAGWEMRALWPFWLVFPFALHFQYKQYLAVRTRNRDTCFKAFLDNNRLGAYWFAAVAANFFYIHARELLAALGI
ncbi:4-hydroxybenzoate octaprenyltransferase [Neisseria bacilliformis]|uniref:4-hydroxybenzoate octaprenyltransferase n=1 Tax=Neisseria bacilliformis TaxID=267212 RepID=UPI000666738E|nr:4-hydroxybenzoate octaprenyltransferase [Neisseria bacilliformis]